MSLSTFASFAIYLSILMGIGLLSQRGSSSKVDLSLGSRSINYWVTALTAHASDMSSWLFMGLPMAIYLGGLSQAWIAIGLIVGMFCNWHFIAQPLREATEKYDASTLPSFFSIRFEASNGLIRYMSALTILIFMVHYLAAGLIAMGFLFDSVLAIDYHLGITLSIIVVALYTCMGGYTAVAWADAFQGIFLLLMIVLVPVMTYFWADLSPAAPAQFYSFIPKETSSLVQSLLLAVSWGLGYLGSPHILAKFMGIRDANNMKKAKRVGLCWQLITLSSAIAVGLLGVQLFPQGLSNPELVFVETVKLLFSPFIAGFVLCAVIAATISTMDSQILVVSALVSEDLYKRMLRPQASDKELLQVSRLSLVAVTLLALYIAWDQSHTVLDTVFYSWTGLGATFGPVVLTALYNPRADQIAVLTGMGVSLFTAMSWSHLTPVLFGVNLPAMLPAFSLGWMTIWGLSLRNPKEKSFT